MQSGGSIMTLSTNTDKLATIDDFCGKGIATMLGGRTIMTAVESHGLHRPASLYVLGGAAAYRFVVELFLAREFVRCSSDEFRVSERSEPSTVC